MRLTVRILSTCPDRWPAALRPSLRKSTTPGLRAELADRHQARPAAALTVLFRSSVGLRHDPASLEPAL